MPKSRRIEHIVALKSKFKLEDRFVLFGRARLLADRIILKGIGYKKVIPLDDIVEIRWIEDRLTIVLGDGEEVPLQIRSAAIWKYELQARCDLKDHTFTSPLPHRPADRRDAREERSGSDTESADDNSIEGGDTNAGAGLSYKVTQQFSLQLDQTESEEEDTEK